VIVQSLASTTDVVQEVLALIQAEGLLAGDRLPSIRQLSARLGARPHVVRDALLQAQTLGHVKVVPRSRAIVQTPRTSPNGQPLAESVGAPLEYNDHHMFHLLQARQMLEFEIVRQAARRRRLEDLLPAREALTAMNAIREPHRRPEFVEHDIRFHLAIARVADNPVLTAMLRPLLTTLRPFLCQLGFDADCRDRTQRSHAEIYRALVAGDADLAHEQMQDHLRLAYDNLLGELQTVTV
jgi:GntR family transcriptional regulator, transcriptional repressor for pyruvate dehydrogenase complex